MKFCCFLSGSQWIIFSLWRPLIKQVITLYMLYEVLAFAHAVPILPSLHLEYAYLFLRLQLVNLLRTALPSFSSPSYRQHFSPSLQRIYGLTTLNCKYLLNLSSPWGHGLCFIYLFRLCLAHSSWHKVCIFF